jgi:hypothetical protein
MWTTANRPKYNRDKLRYPSDLTESNPNRAWGFSQLATGVNETDWTVRAGEVDRSEPKLSLR